MTRTFNEKIRCTRCGTEFTNETDFERWMRNHPRLDSTTGIVRFDIDLLLHRYKVEIDGKGTRDIQCIMFVEIKTRMAEPTAAQIDTLSMLNQVLRNRRRNIHSVPRRQSPGAPTAVFSKLLKREVELKMYGGHLLQLNGTDPENASGLVWDGKYILTKDDLIELLRFERDPDRPHLKIDHRRRSVAWKQRPQLPGFE